MCVCERQRERDRQIDDAVFKITEEKERMSTTCKSYLPLTTRIQEYWVFSMIFFILYSTDLQLRWNRIESFLRYVLFNVSSPNL